MPCFLFVLMAFVLLSAGCAKADEALPVFEEEVSVTIPGMTEEVRLLYLSDLHMVVPGEGVDPALADDVAFREQYSTYEAVSAAGQWSGWVDTLNRIEGDAVLLNGDILDFCTAEGVEELRSGLERLNKPFLYARADHDLLPTYLLNADVDGAKASQDSLCPNEDVMTMEFEDFIVVAWNNSTSNLSDAGLAKIRETVEIGKPLILLTHVPVEPQNDTSLAEASKAAFSGRSLIYGYNDAEYWPEENTRKLLDYIYTDDSPFVEILCGHLHLSWDGYVSESVHEHVFPAAFQRYMGVITVKGE